MEKNCRFLLAQINPTIGDITGNLQLHRNILASAQRDNIDLVIFPELAVCGYSPQDLLLRPDFITEIEKQIFALQDEITAKNWPTAIIGFPKRVSHELFNCAAILFPDKAPIYYHKQRLPNYGVFDEKRYFSAGSETCVFPFHGIHIALLICEDIWFDQPIDEAMQSNAQLIISIHASPYEIGKPALRVERLRSIAVSRRVPIMYVNQAGAQDELVFDGQSMYVSAAGEIHSVSELFQAGTNPFTFTIENHSLQLIQQQRSISLPTTPNHETVLKKALTLGLAEYLKKNRFADVVVGVSGGIDSALVLALACEAIGAERVHAVIMPSRYTSQISIDDAESLCNDFSVKYDIVSIEPVFQAYLTHLHSYLPLHDHDVTSQNIQARCRGNFLMAYANAKGKLVLTTGNRSELAMGYCTLYGDMAGGFAVIKDLYKQEVYALAKTYSAIPKRILTRAPTAELAPDQKDIDSLPPYPILDSILMRYLDHNQSIQTIADELKLDIEFIQCIVKRIQQNEYKRKQLPIGTRLRHHSFGLDRRFPVTSRYP